MGWKDCLGNTPPGYVAHFCRARAESLALLGECPMSPGGLIARVLVHILHRFQGGGCARPFQSDDRLLAALRAGSGQCGILEFGHNRLIEVSQLLFDERFWRTPLRRMPARRSSPANRAVASVSRCKAGRMVCQSRSPGCPGLIQTSPDFRVGLALQQRHQLGGEGTGSSAVLSATPPPPAAPDQGCSGNRPERNRPLPRLARAPTR